MRSIGGRGGGVFSANILLILWKVDPKRLNGAEGGFFEKRGRKKGERREVGEK